VHFRPTYGPRLDDNVRSREALQIHGIGAALSLIPNEILGRFHDDPKRYSIRELAEFADRGLVIAVTPPADEPGQATARPHPDVMFVLRLTETPDPATG
jgi:hypothetical protein